VPGHSVRHSTPPTITIETIDHIDAKTEGRTAAATVMTETMMMITIDGTGMTKTDGTTTNADAATGHPVADLRAELQADPETMGEITNATNSPYDVPRIDPATQTRHGQTAVVVRQRQH
jgi:hypothetical protein